MKSTSSVFAGLRLKSVARIVFAALVLLVVARAAAAQDRPFGFSFSPGAWERDGTVAYIEPGYSNAGPRAAGRDGFETRIGVEALVGGRVSLISSLSFGEATGGSVTALRTEALYHVLRGARAFHLAAGTGYAREADGTSVWLGRVVGERTLRSGRVVADVRLEKPFRTGRDALDVSVSLGALRRLGGSLWLGGEAVGEDLEGLVDAQEAEGGARILVGPTFHWARPESRWFVTLAGGPVFHPRANDRRSLAPRALDQGFAVRLSFAYTF